MAEKHIVFAKAAGGSYDVAFGRPKKDPIGGQIPFDRLGAGDIEPRALGSFAAPEAGVVELVDTQDLGSCGASRGGSSPSTRTNSYPA